ncbi:MAG: dTDP-4-dehydrorhamnose reductase [Candidatus Delongbacteria bacterium]|nr:dTDP-4-dehydrorhamnose reductase [Candidatus Delongbacteria bacterium]MBN2836939.1 dTDP-4-dehydrorhamnose reductase [Candidatus Delongbacteria bacterium]
MKILVTGANGQLGTAFKNVIHDAIFFGRELDITSYNTLDNYLSSVKIDLIINCAAYTKVDKAEDEKEEALKVNTSSIENLVKLQEKYNFSIIHFSTDYVFDGKSSRPYRETDQTCPINYYGQTKLASEDILIKNSNNYLIFRISWLYYRFGYNFVKTMLNIMGNGKDLNIVSDQIGSPTNAFDLADVINKIINNCGYNFTDFKGIYNFSNEGVASWYDFAKAISRIKNYNNEIKPILTKDYPTAAKRPSLSVLDKSKVKSELNVNTIHWYDSLERELKEFL